MTKSINIFTPHYLPVHCASFQPVEFTQRVTKGKFESDCSFKLFLINGDRLNMKKSKITCSEKPKKKTLTIDIEYDWESGMKKFKFSFTIDKNSKTKIDRESFSVETIVTTTAIPSTPSTNAASTTVEPESGEDILIISHWNFHMIVKHNNYQLIYSCGDFFSSMSVGIHKSLQF